MTSEYRDGIQRHILRHTRSHITINGNRVVRLAVDVPTFYAVQIPSAEWLNIGTLPPFCQVSPGSALGSGAQGHMIISTSGRKEHLFVHT